jgi:DNA-binding winged helix-turn-helix (wHTH) protein
MGSKSFVFRFDDVEVREREFSLVKADQALTVEPKAFRVLLFLLRSPQRLVSKEELLNAVWGDVAVGEGSLTRCIWMLRNALGDDTRGTRSRYIETVPTVGYRFLCKVGASEEAQGEPEAAEKPNGVSGVETKVGSRRQVGAWVLTGCVVLALCGSAWWYVNRPLPPLRVTGTNAITHGDHHDHGGWIAGTDGARIYFNYDPPTTPVSWGVYMVNVSGEEIQKLPLGVGPVLLWDVSPDGSNLLVSSPEPSALWSVGVPGGPAHFITDVKDSCWNFRWSPDGKYIAYSDGRKGQEGLYVMGRDGTDVRKLVTLKATDDISEPLAWSPDGSRIRFTDHDSLWEVTSTGANLHPLFPKWKGPAGQCCGEWTPDGDFYLFLAGSAFPKFLWTPEGGSIQIWSLDERNRFILSFSLNHVQLSLRNRHFLPKNLALLVRLQRWHPSHP